MSNPRFAAGDLVAVCNSSLTIVIPTTSIIAVIWREEMVCRDFATSRPVVFAPGWYYKVDRSPLDAYGASPWIAEHCLRKITPGEYTEDTQDLHAPIEEGA